MLYVVPTPIGNLGDLTIRAIDVLRQVDLIACEDTRTSATLLNHHGIRTARISYHEHNERSRTPQLIDRLRAGEDVALISDAGMPGISDPAFFLIRECLREDIRVTVLPGASAALTAVVGSGLPCDRFVFEGFLPARKGRTTRMTALRSEERTIVLFESPHRIVRTIGDLAQVLGDDRRVAVARELSKIHEEYIRGTLVEVLKELESRQKLRGEFVIVVAGVGSRRPSDKRGDQV